LIHAANEHQIDLTKSVMIGDRYKDIEAGQQAGCKTIWLCQDYQERAPNQPADWVTNTLTQAAQWILTTLKDN
jgi:D-glycero-D-manno-heptose 1,7-bisphosphate phosphatase